MIFAGMEAELWSMRDLFSIVIRIGMTLFIGGVLGAERGLTTAAGLWLAAGFGLALGVGYCSGALIGFAFSLFALVNLKRVDIYIKQHARTMEVYLEYNSTFSLRNLSEYAQEHHFVLFDMQRGKIKTLNGEMGTLVFSVELTQNPNHAEALNGLYSLEGVEYLKEIA